MTLNQAVSWLKAHAPRRLGAAQGPMTETIRGTLVDFGYTYSGPQGAAWASAELQAQVAQRATGGRTILRADAVVQWLDPVPVRDNVTGPRARVTVKAGCPASDANVVGVRNSGTDLSSRLLPAATPAVGLECFYAGLNGHRFQLTRQLRLGQAAAAREAAEVARLPLSHVLGGMVSCPMDDGSAEIVALSYAGRPDVDLWRTLNGCQRTANGFITTATP